MTRTLLPVWNIYKNDFHLDVEEPFETFDWLPNADMRSYYEEARAGLDSIPGSREWLKAYTCPEECMPFFDEMGRRIMCSFGDRHSGSSATILAWNYKRLLNDWRTFVIDTKTYYAKQLYDELQFEVSDIYPVIMGQENYDDFRSRRAPEYDVVTVRMMVNDLYLEYQERTAASFARKEKEEFDGRISVLKHHYKYPTRWRDSSKGSYLFGLPSNISEKMFVAMEQIYPDYRQHIAAIAGKIDHPLNTT
jgi:hypothetical protein